MKKPLVVWLSLICIFGLSFVVYISFNIGLTILVGVPISYLGFAAGIHIISMLWCLVIMANKTRRIETRIRWTVYICFVPFFGIVSYILFGRPYKFKKNKKYFFQSKTSRELTVMNETLHTISSLQKDSPQFKRAFLAALKQQNEQIYSKFKMKYFGNGNDYFSDLLSELNNAKSYILLNMYIIQEGEILEQISNILIEKVNHGVGVYVIYDFLGSYNRFTKTKKKWKKSGINLVGFSPVHFPFIFWNTNYRDHRKDVVIDGVIGYVGGINISDEYCNMSSKFGIWNDSAYKMIGSPVSQIQEIFLKDWNFYRNKFSKKLEFNKIKNIGDFENDDLVQVISCGPNHPTPMHLDVLLSLINSAQKSIWIKTPYFIPPPEVIDALCQASNSGLDVRLILPGRTDKFMILDVSKNRTKKLFDNGVKIYSVNNTFVHEKSYIIDDQICFVGTTNLDYRALYSDQQTMLLIKSNNINEKIKNKMRKDMLLSHLYKSSPSKERSLLKRIFIKMYNIIAPIL